MVLRQLLGAGLAMIVSAGTADAQDFSIDRLVASPSIDGASINGAKLSPDGTRLTFLRGKDRDQSQQDLWEFDIASGEVQLLVDSDDFLGDDGDVIDEVEKARRERQRITGTGIVEYSFSPDGQALLFPISGDLFYVSLDNGRVRQLTRTDATETDAKISPSGGYVSFIRDQNLWVVDLESGDERALTTDGDGPILNGMAEFVAQEEMDRDTGYWWAPDDSAIAYARVDESRVALVNRYELGAEGGVTTIEQRYPFAGTDNAIVTLGVVPVGGGQPAWMDLGDNDDIYLTRVNWTPEADELWVQRQSRDQKKLDLIAFNPSSGKGRTVLTETSESWLNLHSALRFLDGGKQFLWASERDGYNHLYLYQRDGTLVGQLTEGDWVVHAVEGIDEGAGRVYFTGYADTPIEQHLYSVPVDPQPADIIRATAEPGWHAVTVNTKADIFVDNYSSADVPPRLVVKKLSGEELAVVVDNPLDADHPYGPYLASHAAVTFGTLEAEDGQTLHYSLRRPADFDPDKIYPAIINVYGGPGVQRVRNAWSIDFDQILARDGYVVMELDNRGGTNRGKAFEDPIYRHMGAAELADQLQGVAFLKAEGYVDPDRIGIYGWSYGGYMTLMSLAKASDVFAAGMSVAPVTDWRLYDTHYTERYLGKPQDGDAYTKSDVLTYLDGIESPLLVVHGMADDNVFYDHTVRFQALMQAKRKDFQLMTYPGKRHGIRGADARAHLWTHGLKFFNGILKGE